MIAGWCSVAMSRRQPPRWAKHERVKVRVDVRAAAYALHDGDAAGASARHSPATTSGRLRGGEVSSAPDYAEENRAKAHALCVRAEALDIPLWQRLLGRPASESGKLRHGEGDSEGATAAGGG
jgi:hypothetical protein